MGRGSIIAIAIVALVAIFGMYGCNKRNGFVEAEEAVKAQWGQVNNQYQRRLQLIPNIMKTVEAEANFEKSTITAVTEARANATKIVINPENLDEQSMLKYQQAQGALSQALSRLLVASENYPNLKSSAAFSDMRVELEGTENRIAQERRVFNELARDYNTGIKKFPGSIFAWGFMPKAYFEASAGAENAPEVNFNIK